MTNDPHRDESYEEDHAAAILMDSLLAGPHRWIDPVHGNIVFGQPAEVDVTIHPDPHPPEG